ncbi:PAS domain S-box protein [Chloroflexota bacterium]
MAHINTIKHRHSDEEIRTLSHALDQSPSIIMITDCKGTIEYVNHKFTEVTGYARQKIKPQPAQPKYILTEPGVGYCFCKDPG